MNTYLAQNAKFQRAKEVTLFKTENFSVFSFTEEGLARGLKMADKQPPIRQPTLTAKQKAQAARAEKKAAAKARANKAEQEKKSQSGKLTSCWTDILVSSFFKLLSY